MSHQVHPHPTSSSSSALPLSSSSSPTSRLPHDTKWLICTFLGGGGASLLTGRNINALILVNRAWYMAVVSDRDFWYQWLREWGLLSATQEFQKQLSFQLSTIDYQQSSAAGILCRNNNNYQATSEDYRTVSVALMKKYLMRRGSSDTDISAAGIRETKTVFNPFSRETDSYSLQASRRVRASDEARLLLPRREDDSLSKEAKELLTYGVEVGAAKYYGIPQDWKEAQTRLITYQPPIAGVRSVKQPLYFIKELDFSGMVNVTEICSDFLCGSKFITKLDFSGMTQVKKIGANFLMGAAEQMRVLDLSPFASNLEEIGPNFLYDVMSLNSVILKNSAGEGGFSARLRCVGERFCITGSHSGLIQQFLLAHSVPMGVRLAAIRSALLWRPSDGSGGPRGNSARVSSGFWDSSPKDNNPPPEGPYWFDWLEACVKVAETLLVEDTPGLVGAEYAKEMPSSSLTVAKKHLLVSCCDYVCRKWCTSKVCESPFRPSLSYFSKFFTSLDRRCTVFLNKLMEAAPRPRTPSTTQIKAAAITESKKRLRKTYARQKLKISLDSASTLSLLQALLNVIDAFCFRQQEDEKITANLQAKARKLTSESDDPLFCQQNSPFCGYSKESEGTDRHRATLTISSTVWRCDHRICRTAALAANEAARAAGKSLPEKYNRVRYEQVFRCRCDAGGNDICFDCWNATLSPGKGQVAEGVESGSFDDDDNCSLLIRTHLHCSMFYPSEQLIIAANKLSSVTWLREFRQFAAWMKVFKKRVRGEIQSLLLLTKGSRDSSDVLGKVDLKTQLPPNFKTVLKLLK